MKLPWIVATIFVVVVCLINPISLALICAGLCVGLLLRFLFSASEKARKARVTLRTALIDLILATLLAVGLAVFLVALEAVYVVVSENLPSKALRWAKYGPLIVCLAMAVGLLPRILRLFPGRRRPKRIAIEAIVLFLGLITILFFSLSAHFMSGIARRSITATCSVAMEYLPESNSWSISEEMILPATGEAAMFTRIASGLQSCGWEPAGTVGNDLRLTKTRQLVAKSSWLRIHTLNRITLADDLDCTGGSIRLSADSRASLLAPKHSIASTSPSGTRTEVLGEAKERLVLPLEFGFKEPQEIDVEVVNPLFRNAVGAQLLGISFWEPLKWLLTALCGIFAEQIKSAVLVPMSKKIFGVLGLTFLENKRGEAPSEDEGPMNPS